MLNKMRKIIFLIFLLSCANDNIINSNIEINPNNLNIMTWNIESFPKNNQTIGYVAQIINALDVDIIALQEITNQSDLIELANSLNGNWDYSFYSNDSWGLAYLINTDNISIIQSPYSILQQYDYEFAGRPPYVLEFNYNNQNIILMNIHFKCCDGSEQRRADASYYLDGYISNNLYNENVIVVGDFNDSLIDDDNVFDVFLNKPEDYAFADYPMAQQDNNPLSYWSFPTYPSHIDHILISNELFDEYQNEGSTCSTLLVDQNFPNYDSYDDNVSDHRPVIISLKIN